MAMNINAAYMRLAKASHQLLRPLIIMLRVDAIFKIILFILIVLAASFLLIIKEWKSTPNFLGWNNYFQSDLQHPFYKRATPSLSYKDIVIFSIVPQTFQHSSDLFISTLRSFVGSFHHYTQSAEQVPRILIFHCNTQEDSIIESHSEEFSWWSRFEMINVQKFFGLSQSTIDSCDDGSFRKAILQRLLEKEGGDSSVVIWLKFDYVFEPERTTIETLEKTENLTKLKETYEHNRLRLLILASIIQELGKVQLKAFPHNDARQEDIVLYGATSKIEMKKKHLEKKNFNEIHIEDIGLIPVNQTSTFEECHIQIQSDNIKKNRLLSPVYKYLPSFNGPQRKKKVAIAFPTTSIELKYSKDPVFLTSLLPSIAKTVTKDDLNKLELTLYIGFDHGDTLYEDQSTRAIIVDKIQTIFAETGNPKVNIQMIRFPRVKRVALLWNLLFERSIHDGMDYFYQVNDDLTMHTPGWLGKFTSTLDKANGFGVVGPADNFNDLACKILTQAMVTPIHYTIFGWLYPPQLKDWKSDRWLTQVYKPFDASHCFPNFKADNGAAPTRYRHCESLHWIIYLEEGKKRISEWITSTKKYSSNHQL